MAITTLPKVQTQRNESRLPGESGSGAWKIWAGIGAVLMAIIVVGWTRWLLSGPTATQPGPDDYATAKLIWLRTVEFGGMAISLFLVWRFLIRSLIRERRLSFDGMMVIGCFFMWFWDPAVNMYSYSFAYNAHLINLGSWANYIPGWRYPKMELLPEPLVLNAAAYLWLCFGLALLGCWVCRTVTARNPGITRLKMWLSVFAVMFAVDLVIETLLFVFAEIWAYPGGSRFPLVMILRGSRYQFPLIEPFSVALIGCVWSAMRYYRDDRGQSFVEKGISDLKVPQRLKTGLRLLAVIGFMHTAEFVFYMVPFLFGISLQADTFPPMPSYMRAGICGTGTDTACSSPFVPTPSRDSVGNLRPDDPRLPPSVRDGQGLRPAP